MPMKPYAVQGIYLVTDRDLCGGRSLAQVVEAAISGGVSCVQLREKNLGTKLFLEEARSLKALLADRGIPLIINDRIDVALAIEADGIHIGQQDMPYPLARQLMGPDAIIGLSVETMGEVDEAEAWDVDYLGVSPIYETATKTDTKGSWGLDGLAKVRAESRHRLVAIGGLNHTNIAQVMAAGADSVAVVSAICAAPDPEQSTRALFQQLSNE